MGDSSMLANAMNLLCAKLNTEYTKRGVNGVAKWQQLGHNSAYVFCAFDVGDETYLVAFEDGRWQFIREFERV